MNDYCIYIHTNKINGKVYIGKTCQEPRLRFGSNGSGYRVCPAFYNAIKKYGWDNFSHDILCDGLTAEEANEKEIEYIALYDSTNKTKGYNLRNGGDGFDSAASKDLWANQDYVNRVKAANKKNWADEEYRTKIVNRMNEAWKDPEKRKRRSNDAKARWADEAFHDKATAAVKEVCKTSVRCVETGEIFEAVCDACKKYNIHHANLIRAIRKGCRSGGVHWEYV